MVKRIVRTGIQLMHEKSFISNMLMKAYLNTIPFNRICLEYYEVFQDVLRCGAG